MVKFIISELYAFIAAQPDGEEGVCGFQLPDGGWLPMVAADWQRVEQLRPMAERIAKQTGVTITLARFSGREARWEIAPRYQVSWIEQTITCRQCGLTSAHPEDVKHRYCGHCHQFHREAFS